MRMTQRHINIIEVLTDIYGSLDNVPEDSPSLIELQKDLGTKHRRLKTDLDETDKALYIDLWNKGFNVRDIGYKLGIGEAAAHTISSNYRVKGIIEERKVRIPYKYDDMKLEKKIVDLLNSGTPIDLVPPEVEMSLESVRIYVKRAIKKGLVKKTQPMMKGK